MLELKVRRKRRCAEMERRPDNREMERICTQCHAVLASGLELDWCPACGGAVTERDADRALAGSLAPKPEVDHRGIVLPRRHALGGIITPQ